MSFKNAFHKSSPLWIYLHLNSLNLKNSVPFYDRGSEVFICHQWPSILFVWKPSRLTNSMEVCCSVWSSTVTMKHFCESSSMLPKTHWPSMTCPQWYFLFPILLSSIWNNFPGPPMFSLPLNNATSHTLRQNMSQSMAVFKPSPSCGFICHWFWSCHQQYVNLNTSPILKFAFLKLTSLGNALPDLAIWPVPMFNPIHLRSASGAYSTRRNHSLVFQPWQGEVLSHR